MSINIEEITKENFRNYLEENKDKSVAKLDYNCIDCPISNFVREKLGKDKGISTTDSIYIIIKDNTQSFLHITEKWVTDFTKKIDRWKTKEKAKNSYNYHLVDITGEKCLEFLD